jgi:hypothetical protein
VELINGTTFAVKANSLFFIEIMFYWAMKIYYYLSSGSINAKTLEEEA